MRWEYDAIEGTFELHEEGASGKLSNVWQKNIHGVSDLQEAFLLVWCTRGWDKNVLNVTF
jgi:hypothetical protein